MWVFILKLLIGVGGLFILVHYGMLDLGLLFSADLRPFPLAGAFLLILLTMPLSAGRWLVLVRRMSLRLSFRRALEITFISQFFHSFLPGSYGGDIVRFGLAYRETSGPPAVIAMTMFVDRLSGFLALMIIGLVCGTYLPNSFNLNLSYYSFIALAAFGLGISIALIAGDFIIRLLKRVPGRAGVILPSIGSDVVVSLRALILNPVSAICVIGISLVQFAAVIWALIAINSALSYNSLGGLTIAVAGVWSMIANIIPVTPGGLGVGEAAFSYIAGLLTTSAPVGESYGTIFLAMRLLSLLTGLFGLVPWLSTSKAVQQDALAAGVNLEAAKQGLSTHE
jgi:uncharacterized membrane protein YbhN (UPF0104 family)